MLQYIKLLKQEGPKEWIYNELKEVSLMSFNFKGSIHVCLPASQFYHDVTAL